MRALLALSRLIDRINQGIGHAVAWLILVAVVISSGNAMVRYGLDSSSNAWLEMQWYLFSAVFLLCSGYTLLRNEHIRIDILTCRLSERTQTWIDIAGTVLFLLPMAILFMKLGWPMFLDSFQHHEVSLNAGGLVRWPVKLLIPVGFALLIAQGVSEVIKRIAFLTGQGPNPCAVKAGPHVPVPSSDMANQGPAS